MEKYICLYIDILYDSQYISVRYTSHYADFYTYDWSHMYKSVTMTCLYKWNHILVNVSQITLISFLGGGMYLSSEGSLSKGRDLPSSIPVSSHWEELKLYV